MSPGDDFGAASDAGIGCATIVNVTPTPAYAPATLVATALVSTQSQATWKVLGPSGLITPMSIGPFAVSVDAPDPGTYSFEILLDGGGCPGSASVNVMAPGGIVQPYRVRVTPPASSGLPQQDQTIAVIGNTPISTGDLFLQSGVALTGVLKGPAGPVAGQVAIAPTNGPAILASISSSGAFSVPYFLDSTYSLVLTPSLATLAPKLIGPVAGATLATSTFAVDSGVTVAGVIRDPSSQPLVGATIALHAGLQPSGVGIAGADGSYKLATEPGMYDLSVSAPTWPDLALPGVAVSGATTLGIDYSVARVAVTMHVVRADGTTPVAGASVTLQSGSIANAATVHTTSGDKLASATARVTASTATDGTVTLMVPAAVYDVLVDPGTLATSEGITGRRLTVSSAGPLTFAVATSALLSGHVLDGSSQPVSGARVRALPTFGAPVETTSATDGSFSFSRGLGSGLALVLEIDNPPTGFAGTRVTVGDTTQLGGALPATRDVTLASGLVYSGTVRAVVGSTPVAGASIDVFCESCSDDTPLYHTDADAVGGYTLYFPNPGVLDLDGGTNADL